MVVLAFNPETLCPKQETCLAKLSWDGLCRTTTEPAIARKGWLALLTSLIHAEQEAQ